MEYEKITYINARMEKIEFGIDGPFYCNVSKDVTGIAGIENTIFSTNSMGQSGDTFIGQRFDAREILIVGHIKETEKDNVLELRRKAEKILNAALSGKLIYQYKDFIRVIDCRVDGKPIFKRNSVFTQFSIPFTCHSPFWREEIESRENIAAWLKSWEFDFEIPNTGIELGFRQPSVIVTVNNAGDVSSGMRIEFKALGAVTNPKIINLATREYIQINMTMQTGDILEVCTEYGNKTVKLYRKDTEMNYFSHLDVDSSFMQLEIGDNVFRYEAGSGELNLECTIYHFNKFLGV